MKEALEELGAMIGSFAALWGGANWLLKRIETKAKEKEQLVQMLKRIEEKLLNLEANDGRLTEELEDVRRDFAQFVQQLFLKNKPPFK